jgi:hypothetical protein
MNSLGVALSVLAIVLPLHQVGATPRTFYFIEWVMCSKEFRNAAEDYRCQSCPCRHCPAQPETPEDGHPERVPALPAPVNMSDMGIVLPLRQVGADSCDIMYFKCHKSSNGKQLCDFFSWVFKCEFCTLNACCTLPPKTTLLPETPEDGHPERVPAPPARVNMSDIGLGPTVANCAKPGDCGLAYEACCAGFAAKGSPCGCALRDGQGAAGSSCGDCGAAYSVCCAGFKAKGFPCTCDVGS